VRVPLLFLILLVAVTACSTIGQRPAPIDWPEKIVSMDGQGDLVMNWRDLKFSGTVSLRFRSPDLLHIEVYGPFGNTLVLISKEGDRFLFLNSEERVTDQSRFEEHFGITLQELMEAIAVRGSRERRGLKVRDSLREENRICWEGEPGSFCITFTEATFSG
jgi:hypothetical protein